MKRTRPAEAQAVVDRMGQQAWMELVRRYGTSFRHGQMIVTTEADAVRALLMEKPHVQTRPAAHRLMARLPGVGGVLFLDGDKWLSRTRALAPVFHRDNVDAAGAGVYRSALDRVETWHRAGSIADLYEAVQQFGAATVLETGYGVDPAHPLGASLAQAMVRFKNRTMSPRTVLRFDRFHTGIGTLLAMPRIIWRMKRDQARVQESVEAILAAGAVSNGRPNWVHRLVDAGLSGAELASELNHLYGAFNAIDYVGTAALYELARHRALAAAVRQELASTSLAGEYPSRDDLDRMPILNGFLREILRLYPVSMAIVRETGAPMMLGGEELPAGSQVMILLPALHQRPDYWEEPGRIKPERWASSSEPRVPFSYVPFLLGARKCQGRDMAEQHLLLLVTAVVRRFDLRVFGDAFVPPFMVPRFGAPIPFALEPAA